jgi:hypothetical protein
VAGGVTTFLAATTVLFTSIVTGGHANPAALEIKSASITSPGVVPCGQETTISALVTTNGSPGELTLHWELPDGSSTSEVHQPITSGRKFTELLQMIPKGTDRGGIRLIVTEPRPALSNTIVLACR